MPVIIKTRPGGSDTQVQFNDGGSFGGSAGLVFDNSKYSLAVGYAGGGGSVYTAGYGSFVSGYTDGAGKVYASGYGSFAIGRTNTGTIRSTSRGSFVGGYTYNGFITASANGAFAFGYSGYGYGNIIASANNAVQFGPGTNTQTDSLSVGTKIRLKGTTGVPGTPRNGDIWEASNYVYIQSNGSPIKIV